MVRYAFDVLSSFVAFTIHILKRGLCLDERRSVHRDCIPFSGHCGRVCAPTSGINEIRHQRIARQDRAAKTPRSGPVRKTCFWGLFSGPGRFDQVRARYVVSDNTPHRALTGHLTPTFSTPKLRGDRLLQVYGEGGFGGGRGYQVWSGKVAG